MARQELFPGLLVTIFLLGAINSIPAYMFATNPSGTDFACDRRADECRRIDHYAYGYLADKIAAFPQSAVQSVSIADALHYSRSGEWMSNDVTVVAGHNGPNHTYIVLPCGGNRGNAQHAVQQIEDYLKDASVPAMHMDGGNSGIAFIAIPFGLIDMVLLLIFIFTSVRKKERPAIGGNNPWAQ